ncbi:MAG: glycosyltransferase family 4 protein [Chthoniobacterales bacterium]
MNIHVWVPDYASAIGGIQTFSRFLVRALREIYPEARICVLSKNDTSYPDADQDWTTNFTPLGWWPLKLRTAAFSAELFRQAATDRPDLIITTHPNFAPLALSLQKLFRIPFIAVGHGIDVWEISGGSIRNALAHATPLVAVSEFTRQRMAAAVGMNSDAIRVLPNTFDPEKFTLGSKPRFLLKRYGLMPKQPVILTISRLASVERYKGYDQVLLALAAVREEFPDVRYILGGRGPDRPRVEALIEKLGVRDNVILAGYVPEHELRAHYNLCDVFAMPSKGEGFGIVFLEAMACGKPVIAGNKDGSVDAVLGGELGALVDPDSVQEIAETLIAILERQKAEIVKTEKLKEKVEGAVLRSPNSDLRELHAPIPLPDIMFDPEALRARVIEAYGYERFKERLRDVLAPLLKS